ncbi:MAG: caspase family protein [Coleofasciculaceae cyanobacterium]
MANMGIDRRTFLQKASLGLAALGVSETVLSLLSDKSLAVPTFDRYFQVLAQPGRRKLALLVGINQYPRATALGGCVTDVELQKELLIHRFGVNTKDILTLTDSEATRENIETAFLEHLTNQAKSGDVVVFHFSGYGSRVKIPQDSEIDSPVRLQNSLVPVDGILPSKGTPVGNDLLEETLFLLLKSLATDHVTTVLDTSYASIGKALQGSLRVRSIPNPPAEAPSPGELVFRDQVRLRLKARNLTPNLENFNKMPGIVLNAAGSSQAAAEAQWQGFSAGLFTYALTQYLWQAAPATTVQVSMSRSAGTVNRLVGKEQQPQLTGQKVKQKPLLAYYLPPDPTRGADGVVTAVEENGKTAQLWLAGLPTTVLDYYATSSLLELVSNANWGLALPQSEEVKTSQAKVDNPQPQPTDSPSPNPTGQVTPSKESQTTASTKKNPILLQLRSKDGLTAKARLVGANLDDYQLEVGQLVQESVRVLPRNLGLTIALASELQRIERVDATSAFLGVPSVLSVVGAGEQPADYLFGQVKEAQATAPNMSNSAAKLDNSSPSGKDSSVKNGGYGLFYLAKEPIDSTTGEVGEAVKSAVSRLTPKLKTLLAAKLLRMTANEGSSRLGLRVSLEMIEPEQKIVMQRQTLRASKLAGTLASKNSERDLKSTTIGNSLLSLPIGSRIQYRLENYSEQPIYFMLFGLDTSSNLIALYKIRSSNQPTLKNAVLEAGETLILPQASASFDWVISGLTGLTEIQLICSRSPFQKALMTIESTGRAKGGGERIEDLYNPLEVARAVLQDLNDASAVSTDLIGTVSDSYVLDVKAWATLSFIYEVV